MYGRIARLMAEFYRTPWGLLPETLEALRLVLHRAASGARLTEEEIRAAVGGAPEASAARRERERAAGGDMIAVLPVSGVIGHRAALVRDVSSGVGTSTELLGEALRRMLADPAVGAIVLDVDSPGGSAFGVGELSDQIYAARGAKPIVASINAMAASAAYWIASAADEVVITPSGVAGSIGIWSAHDDYSKYMENEGVRRTLVWAGKYKVEGHPWGPLSDEARAAMQDMTDKFYAMFIAAVARNRGDTQTAVREGYGEGRVLVASDAVRARLADRVGTFDQVIGELQDKLAKARKAGATPHRARAERELRLLGAEEPNRGALAGAPDATLR